MGRSELERLSREELIELVLRLQRPEKTSRTSSKPPATDRKEQREQSKPGGAKPGHEGHSRVLSDDPDAIVEHRPEACACCGGGLHADSSAEIVSVSERIELPAVAPIVTQHRRLAVRCPSCGDAGRRTGAGGGARHAVRPAAACGGDVPEDLSGALLRAAAGGAVRPVRPHAQPGRADEPAPPRAGPLPSGRDAAVSTLRKAEVVACDETGVRIEGSQRLPLGVPLGRKPWCTRPRRRAAPSWCGR